MTQHRDLAGTQHQHAPWRWTVTDTSALAALTVTAEDVGKVALVQADNTARVLTGHDPVAWHAVGVVQSVNSQTGTVTLAAGDVGADPEGSASAAETAANTYTDDHATKTGGAHGVPIGEEVEWQSQAQSRADAAETAAKAHADSALSDHESATDPHSQYTTTQQASDAAPVQSVDGKTGAVTLSADYEPRRQHNLTATTDPTVTDDSGAGYEPLSKWVNTSTGEVFVCLDATAGAADWQLSTLTIDDLGSAATAETTDFTPAAHAADTTNPHNVTAAQTGAYTTTDADAQFGTGGLQDTHSDRTDNPHAVTAAQVGADPEGSADAAKTAANNYTDTHVTETGGIHGIPEGERALHTGDQQKYDPDAIIKYRFKAGNQLIGILLSGNTDVTIDWGDGSSDSYAANTTAEHTYADAGTYTVRISGRVDLYRLVTGEEHAFRVESFGTGLGLTRADETLRDSGVKVVPQFVPEGVTDMRDMFRNTSFNQDISSWDVSNVTDMRLMFDDTPFNQDISSWDVSNVTDMAGTFRDAPFNQDISSWDVSNVTTMRIMFDNSSFNQDISSWDVSSVTDMFRMLRLTPFNQDIGSWDVSSVTTMESFLAGGQLSTANYDALLLAWAQLALQNDVPAHFGSSTYSTDDTGDPLTDPAAAREKIITDFNWTITDGGAA